MTHKACKLSTSTDKLHHVNQLQIQQTSCPIISSSFWAASIFVHLTFQFLPSIMSSEKHNIQLSKGLSWLLRHNILSQGLTCSPEGYVDVDSVLNLPKFKHYTVAQVQEVVRLNDKQRFALRIDPETGALQIRANQGHTIEVQTSAIGIPSAIITRVGYWHQRDSWLRNDKTRKGLKSLLKNRHRVCWSSSMQKKMVKLRSNTRHFGWNCRLGR